MFYRENQILGPFFTILAQSRHNFYDNVWCGADWEILGDCWLGKLWNRGYSRGTTAKSQRSSERCSFGLIITDNYRFLCKKWILIFDFSHIFVNYFRTLAHFLFSVFAPNFAIFHNLLQFFPIRPVFFEFPLILIFALTLNCEFFFQFLQKFVQKPTKTLEFREMHFDSKHAPFGGLEISLRRPITAETSVTVVCAFNRQLSQRKRKMPIFPFNS